MPKKYQPMMKALLCVGIILLALWYIDNKRNKPRGSNKLLTWPLFAAQDITGKNIHWNKYRNRVRYAQFIGIDDDNNNKLLNNVYFNWSESIDIFIFTKQYNRLKDKLESSFPRAIIIENNYEEILSKFKSTKYGTHYVFDKAGSNIYLAENNIRYEDGVKRILNLVVNNNKFAVGNIIKENSYINDQFEFKQIANNIKEMGKKYLLVGMIYSFCGTCSSGALVEILKNINLKWESNGSVLLVLSDEYSQFDIEVFKSQCRIEYPVILADKVLCEKWRRLIDKYSISELNNMAFLINPAGKIEKVFDSTCGECARQFWDAVIKKTI